MSNDGVDIGHYRECGATPDRAVSPPPLSPQLDPHSLRVVSTRIPPKLALPGTIANVAVGDRLVEVNGRSLAFLSFAQVKALLTQRDGEAPQALGSAVTAMLTSLLYTCACVCRRPASKGAHPSLRHVRWRTAMVQGACWRLRLTSPLVLRRCCHAQGSRSARGCHAPGHCGRPEQRRGSRCGGVYAGTRRSLHLCQLPTLAAAHVR